MVYCQAKTYGGARCGKDATDQSYFWYYDQNQRVNRVFHLCQDHSNMFLNELMEKENSFARLIDKLYKKVENLKHEKNKSANFSDQRKQIQEAKQNGVPIPKFKSLRKIDDDISETWRKINVYKSLLNNARNKLCRKCNYSLKEPNDIADQIGNKYSHADFHSGHGYRRVVCLFHTECGISWILGKVLLEEKEIKYVRPKLKGQGVLFD